MESKKPHIYQILAFIRSLYTKHLGQQENWTSEHLSSFSPFLQLFYICKTVTLEYIAQCVININTSPSKIEVDNRYVSNSNWSMTELEHSCATLINCQRELSYVIVQELGQAPPSFRKGSISVLSVPSQS